MEFDHYRQEWELDGQRVSGPPFDWSKVDRIVIHYPGADWRDMDFDKNGVEDWRDSITRLRNEQSYYLAQRGYSIGYNAMVDIWGHTWELRGDTFRCAANRGWNERSFAIQLCVDEQNPATPEQVDGCRRLIRQVRVVRPDAKIVSHAELAVGGTNTICPGAGIKAQLAAGMFEVDASVVEPPVVFPPVVDPPFVGEVVDVIVLDYQPGRPGWIRFVWDGVSRVAHVRSGHVAQVLNKAGVRAVTVDRTELLGLLREPATVVSGANPFVGSVHGDRELASAWTAAGSTG